MARIKLVESLADCESRFATLQRRVRSLDCTFAGAAGLDPYGASSHIVAASCPEAEVSLINLSAGQQREWQVLVRQFRSLRASLLAHGNVGPLAIRTSLWALDVTLRAEDYAECLKSLQGLVQQLLPAHLQQARLSLPTSLHTYGKAPGDKQVLPLSLQSHLTATCKAPFCLSCRLVCVGRHGLGQRRMEQLCHRSPITSGQPRSCDPECRGTPILHRLEECP